MVRFQVFGHDQNAAGSLTDYVIVRSIVCRTMTMTTSVHMHYARKTTLPSARCGGMAIGFCRLSSLWYKGLHSLYSLS